MLSSPDRKAIFAHSKASYSVSSFGLLSLTIKRFLSLSNGIEIATHQTTIARAAKWLVEYLYRDVRK